MADMASQNILDKNHGFMKFIIKNQHDRDNYDKEQKHKYNKIREGLESLKIAENVSVKKGKETPTKTEKKNSSKMDFKSHRKNAVGPVKDFDLDAFRFNDFEEDNLSSLKETDELDYVPSKLEGKQSLYSLLHCKDATCRQ
uniref:Uncharacterized protein n=1 Tax=Clytia hemisphaerica TaxID=252671 RepID=A0A7M5XM71_9CNID